jgi:hypothetical protein
MIPYCEVFYDSYKDEITKQLTNLKNAVENIHKQHVTESVNEADEYCSIFTEADANAQSTQNQQTQQPTTNDANKTSGGANLATKYGWVKTCVQSYSGCVLNAIRDRNNDYFKALYALAPKSNAPKTGVVDKIKNKFNKNQTTNNTETEPAQTT